MAKGKIIPIVDKKEAETSKDEVGVSEAGAAEPNNNIIETPPKTVADKIKETYKKAKESTSEAKDFVIETVANKVKETYKKAKESTSEVKNFVIAACPYVINSFVNKAVVGAVTVTPKSVATYLSKNVKGNQKIVDLSLDGKFLMCDNCNSKDDCQINQHEKMSEDESVIVRGKRPLDRNGHSCNNKNLKKIFYINGIITDPKTNCITSKKIANAVCVEVISVYNRTEGLSGDLMECIRNIRKSGRTPSTDSMVELIEKHFGNPPLKPYEELNIYAHSQGGLITQQALHRFKKDLTKTIPKEDVNDIMEKINVKSFGTAQDGWPTGPKYEQFTNIYDPVPQVITTAQKKYHEETFSSDTFTPDTSKSHLIFKPHNNPIDSHSMDNVYIEKLKETSKSDFIERCQNCSNK